MKTQKNYYSKGFEWFNFTIYRYGLVGQMITLLDKYSTQSMVWQILSYISTYFSSYQKCTPFLDKYCKNLSEDVKKLL